MGTCIGKHRQRQNDNKTRLETVSENVNRIKQVHERVQYQVQYCSNDDELSESITKVYALSAE